MGFYNDADDLLNQIEKFNGNMQKINRISKNGKRKYFSIFNNSIVSEYILTKIFETKNFNLGERLWRKDSLYDILIVIGYNDTPIVKGKGSAIFLHLTKKNILKTKGCVAIKQKNMLDLLKYYPTKIKIF